MTLPNQARAPIRPGTTVVYNGIDTLVTRAADPADLTSDLDLVAYDPKPRFHGGVKWGRAEGQWLRREEFDATREKNPLEFVQEAVGRGDPHAPQVGAEVVFAWNVSRIIGTIEVVVTRARIREVVSMTEVTLAVYMPEPPDDPMQADEPVYQLGNVQSHHASTRNDHAQKLGVYGSWCWPDEDLIRPFGPALIVDVHPPHVCGRCKARIKRFVPLYLGRDPRNVSTFEDVSDIKICESCNDQMRQWLGLPPMTTPKPRDLLTGSATMTDVLGPEVLSARASDPFTDPDQLRLLAGPEPLPADPGQDPTGIDEFSLTAT